MHHPIFTQGSHIPTGHTPLPPLITSSRAGSYEAKADQVLLHEASQREDPRAAAASACVALRGAEARPPLLVHPEALRADPLDHVVDGLGVRRPAGHVGDVEHVHGHVAPGVDLGVRDREAVLPEHARDVGEQPAAVGDAQLQPHALPRTEDFALALEGPRLGLPPNTWR
jgi:hypothetical protein